ncbi:MAG: hypothetical protein AAFM92_08510 [Pseudomonadota bacterium]
MATGGTGPKDAGKGGAETREDRLKKALKANMARRKSQARARSERASTETGDGTGGRPADVTASDTSGRAANAAEREGE